jgi:hypothetical protein
MSQKKGGEPAEGVGADERVSSTLRPILQPPTPRSLSRAGRPNGSERGGNGWGEAAWGRTDAGLFDADEGGAGPAARVGVDAADIRPGNDSLGDRCPSIIDGTCARLAVSTDDYGLV